MNGIAPSFFAEYPRDIRSRLPLAPPSGASLLQRTQAHEGDDLNVDEKWIEENRM
jgi:hypothetical protein